MAPLVRKIASPRTRINMCNSYGTGQSKLRKEPDRSVPADPNSGVSNCTWVEMFAAAADVFMRDFFWYGFGEMTDLKPTLG